MGTNSGARLWWSDEELSISFSEIVGISDVGSTAWRDFVMSRVRTLELELLAIFCRLGIESI